MVQVPAATSVKEVPLTVQIEVVLEAKLTVSPLDAVALSAQGDWLRVRAVGAVKVIALAALLKVIERKTCVAAAQAALPAWVALTLQTPVFIKVKEVPLTVQIEVVLEAKLTVSPLDAVALSAQGDWLRVRAVGAVKVIDCLNFAAKAVVSPVANIVVRITAIKNLPLEFVAINRFYVI